MLEDTERSAPQIRVEPVIGPPKSIQTPCPTHTGTINQSRLASHPGLETDIKSLLNFLDVDGCIIFEWERQIDRIVATAGCSRNGQREKATLPGKISFPVNHPLFRQVIVEQCPQQQIFGPAAALPAELSFLEDMGVKTLLLLPMKFEERLVGLVAIVDSQAERVFPEKEIALFQVWANQVASVIELNRAQHLMRDQITKHSQIEKELRWLATRNQAILDAIPDSMLYLNREGQLVGYKIGEDAGLPCALLREFSMGKNLGQIFPAELSDVILESMDRVLSSGAMQVFEYQLALPLGRQDIEMRLVASNPDEVLVVMRNISRRKQAEALLRKNADDLAKREAGLMAEIQRVLALTQSLMSEINPKDLLGFIITQTKHLAHADGAVVLLLSEDGQQLEVVPPGDKSARIRPGSRLSPPGSLAGLAIKNRQAEICNSPHDDERARSILAILPASEIHAFMLAPLTTPKKTLGVLLIWNERERSFSNADGRLISLFANQAGLALLNADLHARDRRQAIQQERDRLARDLHDSVTQSLYGIGLAAQCVLRQLEDEANPSLRNPVEYIHSLSKAALAEMKEQLYHLHPTGITENLVEDVAKHCELLDRQYAVSVEFEYRVTPSLSVDQREALFYITREALWNVVRHARASRARVSLISDDGQVVLSIQDDGIGFDPATCCQTEELGLLNMEERTRRLGGDFELHSTPGQGTHLSARIPL